MFLEILKHTPLWAYAVLVVLIALGIQQSRTRVVSVRRIVILPAALIAWSAINAISIKHAAHVGSIAWVAGAVCSTVSCKVFAMPARVTFISGERIVVPGSWMPFALFMSIYLLRYATGVGQALAPEVVSSLGFVVATSGAYGVVSVPCPPPERSRA